MCVTQQLKQTLREMEIFSASYTRTYTHIRLVNHHGYLGESWLLSNQPGSEV